MRFQLTKNKQVSGSRVISISTEIQGEFFQVEIVKSPIGEITMGCLHYGENFYDGNASIEELKCLHEMSGEALRIANNFEKYWNRK
jgi:hypothetical protein